MNNDQNEKTYLYQKRPVRVSIVLTQDKKMSELSSKYLDQKDVTDVLAFPVNEKVEDGTYLLGEIVVNIEQARRQAKEYRVAVEEEIARLITHGALHLLGYSDDSPESRQTMFEIQEKIVNELEDD